MRSSNTPSIYRPDLGVVAVEYLEGEAMSNIGLQIMPPFPCDEQGGVFPVIPAKALLSVEDTSRAPRGTYNRGDWAYEEGKYATRENGWEEPIDDRERKLFERRAPGQGDFIATRRAMGIIVRNQERRIANKIFNAVNFTAHAVTNEWDDAANATPIDDVTTGKLAFREQCGMPPNALVISYTTFERLRRVAQIVDLLKYTFPGLDINSVGAAELARIFNVPRILVGGAIYDSAGKGLSVDITDIWDNEYAALLRVATDQLDLIEPCVGRTFVWTQDSAEEPIVEQYREENRRSDIFRVRHDSDECLLRSYDPDGNVVSDIAAKCVYLFSNITTK